MEKMSTVLFEHPQGNKEMKMSVSLDEANRMEIAFSASEKLAGEIVLKFGKRRGGAQTVWSTKLFGNARAHQRALP